MEKKSVFATLCAINCNEHTDKKQNLTYLSWAWAWAEVKKAYPTAYYTIYENANGMFYHTDGRTCWVKTGVTIEGIEHIEYLPVMDYKNNSIPLERVTSFDVNKAIQRSLTKACARHGLGLYIYAGEDLLEAPSATATQSNCGEQNNGVQQTKAEVVEEVKEAFRQGGIPVEEVKADASKVESILKYIAQCKTRKELQEIRKYQGTPEYEEIKVAANNKLQSLKS